MTPQDAAGYLQVLASRLTGLTHVIFHRGDTAVLRLASDADPGRWAEIFTRGDVWASVEFSGEYMLDQVDEDATDDDRRASLAFLVDVAAAYMTGGFEVRVSRWLRAPYLLISTDRGPVEVRPILGRTVSRLLRGNRNS